MGRKRTIVADGLLVDTLEMLYKTNGATWNDSLSILIGYNDFSDFKRDMLTKCQLSNPNRCDKTIDMWDECSELTEDQVKFLIDRSELHRDLRNES